MKMGAGARSKVQMQVRVQAASLSLLLYVGAAWHGAEGHGLKWSQEAKD